MYKVMIIDDEPIIVEGLSRSVPWAEHDCRVIATANDGIEGKQLIEEYQPNLLFLDINMPEMDGLTMIGGLKSEFPDLEVSILTGFRDFDYAQQAIRLGVTRFLLKPSNMDEIIEAIEAMIHNLRSKNILSGPVELGDDEIEDTAANSFIVKNAINYIEENYTQKLKLADVAEITYVSQWHLSKLLNRHLGKNFSEILNSIRVEKAKEMLRDPQLRIREIAEETGFLDIAHFSRVFKKQAGISANEYRNQVLGKQDKLY